MPNWLSRTLWMLVQAAAIGGLMYMSFVAGPREGDHPPPQAYFLVFMTWVLLVAFATGIITRLWDWSRSSLARRRAAGRQRQ